MRGPRGGLFLIQKESFRYITDLRPSAGRTARTLNIGWEIVISFLPNAVAELLDGPMVRISRTGF